MSEVRITDPETGGQKGTKPERFDLMPFGPLEEVARVYGFGAEKYGERNYLKGYAYGLALAALLRHVSAWAQGEDIDTDSGLNHLAHAATHCLNLMLFQQHGLGTDDRWMPPAVEAKPSQDIMWALFGADGDGERA